MVRYSDFFSSWLYDIDGYYQNIDSIGKSGDFFTSVSTSSLFGGAIGSYIIKRARNGVFPEKFRIIEIGADRGYLLGDIIRYIYTEDEKLFKGLEFYIVEPFAKNRKRQEDFFKEHFEGVDIHIVEDIESAKCDIAFIVSNELFDAFPCEIYHNNKMAFVEDFKIIFDSPPKEIEEIAKKYSIFKGEIPLGLEAFISNICKQIDSFEFLSFDYGDRHPRGEMSIRIYKDHKTYPLFEDGLDLKELYKQSDITYDVIFQIVSDIFVQHGAKEIFFKRQNSTLIDFGIIEILEKIKTIDNNGYLREANKVKTLLHPSFLGERFKAISLFK